MFITAVEVAGSAFGALGGIVAMIVALGIPFATKTLIKDDCAAAGS